MPVDQSGIAIGPVEAGDELTFGEFTFAVARWPERDADLRGDAALADALSRLTGDAHGR